MPATNKLRICTPDTTNALDHACSEVESAVGLPVQAELQEIEGNCLILELRLGIETVVTPSASRLAHHVDRSASDIDVLSAWSESPSPSVPPRLFCNDVLGPQHDTMPDVAHRAIIDNLPTAQWDRSKNSWHLAVPSACRDQLIVGLLHRGGYSHRFTTVDALGLRMALAS
jgi:hypothetical protein